VDGSGVIDRLALWVPGGLTDEERAVVVGARLRWVGRFVALTVDPTAEHAAFSVARSWRSLTPYLPFNHVKRSGRNTVEGQILRELVDFRGRIAPIAVTARPWTGRRCRLLRSDGRRDGPPARPLDVRVTFAEPVAGPLVLGRHAHFSLGLMTPAEE
jgi:CRISPR-associated protein Csb2